ncbi:MAG TPA: hypothetical protein VGR35_19065 [Tepidisphaeraceae bacterium]|nr:hypothetical protein [Tepidisphaeraceae bacterium]
MRVCYLHLPEHELVFLVTMFAKKEKATLTALEKAAFRRLMVAIKSQLKG